MVAVFADFVLNHRPQAGTIANCFVFDNHNIT
jgi:hypothetical protein